MQNEFTTLDLGEASALVSMNFELIGLDKTKRPKQRMFVFSDGEKEAVKIVENYRRKRLSVDAYTFFIATKELKSRLHDELETGE